MEKEQPQGKRIAFVSARSGFIESDSLFRQGSADGRLIQALSQALPGKLSVAIFSDPNDKRSYSCPIEVNKVYTLPFPFSHPGGLKNVFKIYRVLKKIERENDVLIIQLPIIGFLALLFLRKPVIYHLCANVLSAVDNPFKYKGIHGFLASLFAKILHGTNRILFAKRGNRVIVNGQELGTIYKNFDPKVVVSTSIYSSEIVDEQDIRPRHGGEFRILFVGRPSKEKGIHLLLKAFESLVKKGYPVTLEMIGLHKDELLRTFALNPIADEISARITCHGFVPWGEAFKSIVRNCHALVMCSISEGTPRVLIEGRALGCAVIATDVGGVKTSVTDGYDGLLIKPFDHADIYSSVEKLLLDESARLRLVKNGLASVRSFTIETFADAFFKSYATI